jgi:hypothetical protein
MWTMIWGKPGITSENADKPLGMSGDNPAPASREILVIYCLAVDNVLIGSHESNPPSNNHNS